MDFHICSDDHHESVLSSMQTIVTVLIEESEDVREDLLLVILSVLGRNKSVSISILCWCVCALWVLWTLYSTAWMLNIFYYIALKETKFHIKLFQ